MNKIAVLLTLALSFSAQGAPTYLVCAGNFFNKGERSAMDDLAMAIDFDAKTVSYVGTEYDISSINDQSISAGPVLNNDKISMRMISLNRITGGVTVVGKDAKIQFVGTCKVSTRKF